MKELKPKRGKVWVVVAVLLMTILWILPVSMPAKGFGGPLRTFFAFERDLWMETSGAELVLKRPRRHGTEPVLPRGPEGAPDSHRVSFTTIIPEEGRLRAWYGAIGTPARGSSVDLHRDISIAYAESRDGVSWQKPAVGPTPEAGNVVLPGALSMTVHPDPEGGYRGAVVFFRSDVGQPGAESGATFGIATSPDGLSWNFERDPAISVRHFEAFGMFGRDGRWWVLGQGVLPYFARPPETSYRVMYGFHSEDGKQFDLYPRPLFLYEGDRHFPDASIQNHVGAGIWDRGRILLGFSGQFWPGGFSATASFSIGLIYSYDGINWVEPFSKTPLFLPSERGEWDGGWVLQVQRPVSRNDETYFFYIGGDRGNEWAAKSSLGLAKLRRDGFAAWVPVEEEATMISRPIRLLEAETALYLNARGAVRAQLLDEYLRPLMEPVALNGDRVRGMVFDLREHRLPDSFRLALTLGAGAEFYTFSLGPSDSELAPLDVWE